MILIGAVGLAALLGAAGPRERGAAILYAGTLDLPDMSGIDPVLDSTQARLADAERELARAKRLIDYSARFGIAADLAAMVYDTAERQGMDPELAFRLVYVESRFNPRAVSRADAIGLTQLQVPTARYYQADVTRQDLFDPALNLEIGFRYLNDLLETFDGDLRLALIAYNRGPARLRSLLASGTDPANGYASSVLNGYDPGSI